MAGLTDDAPNRIARLGQLKPTRGTVCGLRTHEVQLLDVMSVFPLLLIFFKNIHQIWLVAAFLFAEALAIRHPPFFKPAYPYLNLNHDTFAAIKKHCYIHRLQACRTSDAENGL
jgi:hypothetical protein